MKTSLPYVQICPSPVRKLEDCLRSIPNDDVYLAKDYAKTILDYGPALQRTVCGWRGIAKCVISTTYRKYEWIKPHDVRVRIEGFTEPQSGLIVVRCKLSHPGQPFSRWDIPGCTVPKGYLQRAVRDDCCVFDEAQLDQVVDLAAALAREWAKKPFAEGPPVEKLPPPMTVDIELA